MDSTSVSHPITQEMLWEILKIIFNILGVTWGAYLGFKYGLKKDKTREAEIEYKKFKELKETIIYFLQQLLQSTINQKENLFLFNKQFNERTVNVIPPILNANFDMDNFIGISRTDIYKLFIEKSTQSEKEKSKALRNFNFVLKVTKKISENIVSDMNKLITAQNQYLNGINDYKKKILFLLNKTLPGEFKTECLKLHDDMVAKGKLNDLYYSLDNYDLPVLALARKHKMVEIVNTIVDGKNWFKQIEGTRKHYYNSYGVFIREMDWSIESINEIIKFFGNEN